MKLRDYQEAAVQSVIKNITMGNNSIYIVMPTGSGKTITSIECASRLNKKTLVLVHTLDLLQQTYRVADTHFNHMNPTIFRRNTKLENHQLIIMTIQSYRSSLLEKFKAQNFELLIIDEAHHALSQSYKTIISHLNFQEKSIIGCTATPIRGDTQHINKIFKEEAFNLSLWDLIEKDVLCDIKGIRVKTNCSLKTVTKRRYDFNVSQLASVINTQERNKLIIDSYINFSKDKKALAFCANIKHATILANEFKEFGISSEAIHGNMNREKRQQLVKKFQDGEINVLTNCQLLTEGFDEPSIETLLMARPTYSHPLYVQMIGRGLRKIPGKKECLILEFTDNNHDICSLEQFANDGILVENMPTFNDFENLKSYRERLRNHKELLYSDGKIYIEQIQYKKKKPIRFKTYATQNQCNLLNKLGIKFETTISYTKAAKLLEKHLL